MPRRRKTTFKRNQYYHLYNRGVDQNNIFYEEQNYLFLLNKIQKYRQKFDVSLVAYCLMPNHYHFLIRQNCDVGIQKFVQSIFNSYSKAFNKKYNRTGTLFEGRFKDIHVNQERYLTHLCAYIHRNPLEAGISKALGSWPYSNLPEWLDQRKGKLFDERFRNMYFGSAQSYLRFLQGYDPPKDFKKYVFT